MHQTLCKLYDNFDHHCIRHQVGDKIVPVAQISPDSTVFPRARRVYGWLNAMFSREAERAEVLLLLFLNFPATCK